MTKVNREWEKEFDEDFVKQENPKWEDIKHDFILDSVKNDTDNTKVFKCSVCGIIKENEVVYYYNCSDGTDYATAPCICGRSIMFSNHKIHTGTKKTLTIETAKAFISQTRNNLLREIMEEMPKKRDYDWVEEGKQRGWDNSNEMSYQQGFNFYHDQVNTLLKSKLSTVKK